MRYRLKIRITLKSLVYHRMFSNATSRSRRYCSSRYHPNKQTERHGQYIVERKWKKKRTSRRIRSITASFFLQSSNAVLQLFESTSSGVTVHSFKQARLRSCPHIGKRVSGISGKIRGIAGGRGTYNHGKGSR